MAQNKFSKGDTVVHKTTDQFEMVIIGNCLYQNPTQKQIVDNAKDPNRYLCKYYNNETDKWEEECFYDFELSSLDEE